MESIQLLDKKTYVVENPMWLSDKFIFKYMKDFDCFVYVKINHKSKIEEIGVDLLHRMHYNSEYIEKNRKEANRTQKSIINRIGDEYWYKIYKQIKR